MILKRFAASPDRCTSMHLLLTFSKGLHKGMYVFGVLLNPKLLKEKDCSRLLSKPVVHLQG